MDTREHRRHHKPRGHPRPPSEEMVHSPKGRSNYVDRRSRENGDIPTVDEFLEKKRQHEMYWGRKTPGPDSSRDREREREGRTSRDDRNVRDPRASSHDQAPKPSRPPRANQVNKESRKTRDDSYSDEDYERARNPLELRSYVHPSDPERTNQRTRQNHPSVEMDRMPYVLPEPAVRPSYARNYQALDREEAAYYQDHYRQPQSSRSREPRVHEVKGYRPRQHRNASGSDLPRNPRATSTHDFAEEMLRLPRSYHQSSMQIMPQQLTSRPAPAYPPEHMVPPPFSRRADSDGEIEKFHRLVRQRQQERTQQQGPPPQHYLPEFEDQPEDLHYVDNEARKYSRWNIVHAVKKSFGPSYGPTNNPNLFKGSSGPVEQDPARLEEVERVLRTMKMRDEARR